ncbi:MAG: glycosyltransferase [Thermodesulfobacteriota bacterium]
MTLDSETPRPIVLTFVKHYLPGCKYGGPVQSIANLVQSLGDEFSFKIVTSDREPGESAHYQGVTPNAWNRVDKAAVYYCAPENRSLRAFRRLMSETPHDVLYLNSFFDPIFTIRPLLLVRYGLVPRRTVVLASRGEFSEGCLAQKAWKKIPYVRVAKTLGLYGGLIWQAANDMEATEIRKIMYGDRARIEVAHNIVVAPDVKGPAGLEQGDEKARPRTPGPLRVLFLSRVCHTKNLDGALVALAKVQAQVEFDIYGPIENTRYWQRCLELMKRLPSNVRARYCGSVERERVPETMAQHDLFFLPTRSESFGHVIIEALSAGTPVLVSDRTPWNDLSESGIGWNCTLNDAEGFARVIESVSRMDDATYGQMREKARQQANRVLSGLDAVRRNRDLFRNAYRESAAPLRTLLSNRN